MVRRGSAGALFASYGLPAPPARPLYCLQALHIAVPSSGMEMGVRRPVPPGASPGDISGRLTIGPPLWGPVLRTLTAPLTSDFSAELQRSLMKPIAHPTSSSPTTA